MNETITVTVLEQFVDGLLESEESETILHHLAQDEESLAVVDALWQERGFVQMEGQEADAAVPALDAETAGQIERKLIDRIQRTDLTGQVVQLGTQAAGLAYWALLRPMVARFSATNDDENDKG